MTEYSIHPAADLFPMMPDSELDQLAADIKTNGQNQPIALIGKQVIDGRNRLEACRRANVTPLYEQIATKDPVTYVISANIHRRQLTTAQRAAIAAELANMKNGGDRKSEKIRGSNDPLIHDQAISAEQAAELMSVSQASVKRAKKVMRNDPEKHEAIKRGEKPRKAMTSKEAGDYWVQVASKTYKEETGKSRSDRWIRDNLRQPLEGCLDWFAAKDKRSLLSDQQAAELQREIRKIAEQERPASVATVEAQAKEAESALQSKTAREKLETAIRVHKRLLDSEFQERVRIEVLRQLDEYLPTHTAEYEYYKQCNDAWRGVFSHQDYKTLKGFLHPDRHPNDPAKAAKLFRLVSEKQEILCGIKESPNRTRPETLPKTAAELMRRRKTH